MQGGYWGTEGEIEWGDMNLCIACFICSVEFCPSVVFCLFLPPSDLRTAIWKHCGFAFSKNTDMKQTGRALGPFVPLLEKTSVGSVFIVQTLEEVILGWWKSLSTAELAGMQQHMLTTTDFIPGDLETLGKKTHQHTNPHSHHSPHQKLRAVIPTTHPAPEKHQCRWQRWHLCTFWWCLGIFGRSCEATMMFSGHSSRPNGHTLSGEQSHGDPLQSPKLGSACPACRIQVRFHVQKLRLFGLHHLWDFRGFHGITFKCETSLRWMCTLHIHLTVSLFCIASLLKVYGSCWLVFWVQLFFAFFFFILFFG